MTKYNWPPGYGLKNKKQNVYKAVGLSSILLFQHLQQTRTPQMHAAAKKTNCTHQKEITDNIHELNQRTLHGTTSQEQYTS